MASIDDEWEQFLSGNPTKLKIDEYDDDDDDNDNDNDIKIPDMPKCRELYISTKTKKPFLNIDDKIDILSLFWKIPMIEYWNPIEGIVKKQMKILCKTEAETAELEQRRTT